MNQEKLTKEFRKSLKGLTAEESAKKCFQILRVHAETLAPGERLRFLLDLDTRLYGYQGKAAVAYGEEVHPKHRHMDYHRFFNERVSEGEQVLDVGCGIGYVAYDLAAKAGARVRGIDISSKNIAQAREAFSHPNLEFIEGDALTAEFEDGVDVVVLSNVLEHLPGRPEFLKKLAQSTGARRFLIRVPIYDREWRVPLKEELGIDYRLDPTHEIEFTEAIFREELGRAGLEIDYLAIRWGEIWSESHVV